MGVIKRGILGGFSGKVGNIVGGSWKGIGYMRSLPLSVANPNTAGQAAQRGKFSGSVTFARQILGSIIQVFWNPIAAGMSGYNRFMSENIESFDSSGVLVPATLKMTVGPLLGIELGSVTADASAGEIDIVWPDNSGTGNAVASDEVGIAYYNFNTDQAVVQTNIAARSDGSATLGGLTFTAGDVLAVYVFCNRVGNPKIASNSNYSAVTVAP